MTDFDPDWCMRPGVHIEEFMEYRGIGVRPLARECGMTPDLLRAVISGEREIDKTIAVGLEIGTRIPAPMWERLEGAYRAALAAGKKDISDD